MNLVDALSFSCYIIFTFPYPFCFFFAPVTHVPVIYVPICTVIHCCYLLHKMSSISVMASSGRYQVVSNSLLPHIVLLQGKLANKQVIEIGVFYVLLVY